MLAFIIVSQLTFLYFTIKNYFTIKMCFASAFLWLVNIAKRPKKKRVSEVGSDLHNKIILNFHFHFQDEKSKSDKDVWATPVDSSSFFSVFVWLHFFCKCCAELNRKKLADLRKTGLHNQWPHQYALVNVSVADALHTDPDDACVSNLLVVDGQRGRRRAAGWRQRRGVRVQNQRGRAEVWVWGAARGPGQSGTGGGHGGEILCNVVKRAWQRLREVERRRTTF